MDPWVYKKNKNNQAGFFRELTIERREKEFSW